MAKVTLDELLKNKKLLRASQLKEQKEKEAAAKKAFEDAAFEQARNQRFQKPKPPGSVTKSYKREKFEE